MPRINLATGGSTGRQTGSSFKPFALVAALENGLTPSSPLNGSTVSIPLPNGTVKKSDVTEEATDRICPKCGRPVMIKLGRYGRFYSCTGFKKGKKGEPLAEGACDYSEPLEGQKEPQLELLEGEMCPECGKQPSLDSSP